MHIDAALTGFLTGASLLIAIGPQNAFVLRQGLLRNHVLAIVLFCAASDAALIIAGVGGLGALVSASHLLALIIGGCGTAFLVIYGARSFMKALKPQTLNNAPAELPTLRQAVTTCAAFTWGNPHVYLDTVLLVGSLSLPFRDHGVASYTTGACAASLLWFAALGYGARLLIPLFRRPSTWRVLDFSIGLVMWLIAARLGIDLYNGT